MTKEQAEYELRHFRVTPKAENDARMRWILDKWQFSGVPGGAVLEIGPGPYGGCLPFVVAACKIAVEPLWPEYRDAGFGEFWRDEWFIRLHYIEEPIENGPWVHQRYRNLDAILCFNVLEHGTSGFHSIDHIAPLLKPGGRFYLKESLRTVEQLNEAHTHVMLESDLDAAIERNGLKEVRRWIEPVQPGFDYPSVIGIWER